MSQDPTSTRSNPSILLIAPSLIAALTLSILTAGAGASSIDVRVTEAVQDGMPDQASFAIDTLNWVGTFWPLTILSLGVALLLWWRGLRLTALFLLLIALTSQVGNRLLKEVIASPRPPVDYVASGVQRDGLGFPSGHTTSTVMIVGFLVFLGIAHLGRRGRWLAIVIGGALMVAMGMARITVGAHWPSDVLGSYLWGGSGLLLVLALYRRIEARRSASTASASSSGRSQASSITSR